MFGFVRERTGKEIDQNSNVLVKRNAVDCKAVVGSYYGVCFMWEKYILIEVLFTVFRETGRLDRE